MVSSEYLFLRQLIRHKSISFKKGVYSIWGVKMFFYPYGIFSCFKNILKEKLGKDYQDMFYSMGYIQAYNGTRVLIKNFGIKNTEEMHDLMRSQGATFGFGDFIFSDKLFDKNSLYVTKNFNPIASDYLNKFGKSTEVTDFYNLGLIVGASEAWYNKNISGTEKKCKSKGDDSCVFELKESSSLKRIKYLQDFLKKEKLTILLKKDN